MKLYSFKRFLKRIIFSFGYNSFFINSKIRIALLRLCGVKIGKNCFIGQFVFFDDLAPESIIIEDNCFITSGTKILAHYINTDSLHKIEFVVGREGGVHIKSGCFIGMNTLIVKPVTINENTVIAAGSVITCDIPANVIAGGNPCKIIKERK
ncbi:hypothetical protein FACS189450_12600 [Spirochaetia bacterium]|nr:hypothetical protein FACS189450_12600 [Spirochaetia bacterium]